MNVLTLYKFILPSSLLFLCSFAQSFYSLTPKQFQTYSFSVFQPASTKKKKQKKKSINLNIFLSSALLNYCNISFMCLFISEFHPIHAPTLHPLLLPINLISKCNLPKTSVRSVQSVNFLVSSSPVYPEPSKPNQIFSQAFNKKHVSYCGKTFNRDQII